MFNIFTLDNHSFFKHMFTHYPQRPLWCRYYQNTDVLIFVVDSNDRERMPECQDELQRFLAEDELKNCVLLVMANKQDLPNAMSTEEVAEKLELNSLRDKAWRKCSIFVASFLSPILQAIESWVGPGNEATMFAMCMYTSCNGLQLSAIELSP